MSPELAGLFAAGSFGAVGVGAMAAWSLFRPPRLEGIPVLRYRIVGPALAGSPLNEVRVPVSRFAPQIRYVARRGFRAVTLSEAVARLEDRSFRATNPIVFCFDGPYRTFIKHAWPIMRSHGLAAATLFFPPNRLGETHLAFKRGRPEPVLSLEELAGLAREGVELGVQASAADDLPREKISSDLAAARKALSALSEHEVDALTLNFTTKRAVRAAVDAGYRVIAAIGDGVISEPSEAAAVPRFPIMPDTTLLDVALVVSRRYEGAIW